MEDVSDIDERSNKRWLPCHDLTCHCNNRTPFAPAHYAVVSQWEQRVRAAALCDNANPALILTTAILSLTNTKPATKRSRSVRDRDTAVSTRPPSSQNSVMLHAPPSSPTLQPPDKRFRPELFARCMPLYQYKKLRQGEIRLLQILPGHYSDPVQCTLSTVSINEVEQQPYEALSYTWGALAGMQWILVIDNDASGRTHHGGLKVRWNCYNTLKRLRREDSSRTMWIDAICIDQDNLEERSQQVGFMSRIYSLAEQVVVCLRYWDKVELPYETKARESMIGRRPLEPTENRVRGGMIDDFCRDAQNMMREYEWFHRVWVVQEVVNARKVVFVCGRHQTPWDAFVSHFGHYLAGVWSLPVPLSQEDWKNLNALDAARILRPCRATEPLDKVFAVPGLLRDDPGITIDYTRQPDAAYTLFARETISGRGESSDCVPGESLDILSDAIQSTPACSWAPDWNKARRVMPVGGAYNRFEAGGCCQRARRPWRLLRTDHLRLQIIKLGRIADCAEPWGTEGAHGHRFGGTSETMRYNTIQRDWTELARGAGLERASEELRCLLRDDHAIDWVDDRRLLLLDTGVLCLGPRVQMQISPVRVEVGDMVCIILGARTPFILREASHLRRPDPDGLHGCESCVQARLVGDCYVSGVMHGEAVRWDWRMDHEGWMVVEGVSEAFWERGYRLEQLYLY
ncbi:Uu.00g024710.m01.CDS01 [Anthostomella pinea]|uniref:Uu.00g024710.m01.CDS01 n=1 Tax=Anthostomella pinea TaxID=933095 RepID=A0AAI8V794_9PEZI|nr:Uu.00g024710.m01.CDS01 [Anthostomella pinea]